MVYFRSFFTKEVEGLFSEDRFFIPIVLDGPVALNETEIEQISRLLNQLSPSRGDFLYSGNVARILEQNNFRLIIIKNTTSGEIVAMASLHYHKTFRHPDFGIGRVEDVVVDERFRGLGLGDLLLGYLKRLGLVLGLERMELTSNPDRDAANKLYIKHGFKKRDTNCYSLDI